MYYVGLSIRSYCLLSLVLNCLLGCLSIILKVVVERVIMQKVWFRAPCQWEFVCRKMRELMLWFSDFSMRLICNQRSKSPSWEINVTFSEKRRERLIWLFLRKKKREIDMTIVHDIWLSENHLERLHSIQKNYGQDYNLPDH